MKINTISFKNFRVNYFPNFKQKENDEYVDNPQDFGKEDADSFEKSAEKNENNKDKENKKSKYNKLKAIGGTILVAPTAIETFANTIDKSLKNTTDAVKNSIRTIGEIKTEADNVFGKHNKAEETKLNKNEPDNEIENPYSNIDRDTKLTNHINDYEENNGDTEFDFDDYDSADDGVDDFD